MNRSRATEWCTAIALSLLLASCGDGRSSSECRSAATAQAEAEAEYLAALEAHQVEHATGNSNHPEMDDRTFTSRVDMIIATEATERACP